jgi:hypothetical protein
MARRMTGEVKAALDDARDFSEGDAASLQVPVVTRPHGFDFWMEPPNASDGFAALRSPLTGASAIREDGDHGAGAPYMDAPGLELVRVADNDETGSGIAAVLCGSAATVTAFGGTRIVDAEALLTYVRHRVWAYVYSKTRSAARATRAVQALRIIIFLDPLGGCRSRQSAPGCFAPHRDESDGRLAGALPCLHARRVHSLCQLVRPGCQVSDPVLTSLLERGLALL